MCKSCVIGEVVQFDADPLFINWATCMFEKLRTLALDKLKKTWPVLLMTFKRMLDENDKRGNQRSITVTDLRIEHGLGPRTTPSCNDSFLT